MVRRPFIALLGVVLALSLAGCTSAPALQKDYDRLAAENRRLTAENQKLSAEKTELAGRLDLVGKESDRLRDLAGRLEAELQAKDRTRCTVPASLISPFYLNVQGLDHPQAYRKSLTADLDGDAAAETVTLVTNAGADPKTGEFGWDDGHPWHVYVDEPDGTRTLVFANWVQLGMLKLALGENSRLILESEQGAGTQVYEVTYRGPNQVDAVQLVSYQVFNRASFPPGSNFRD